MTPADTTPTTWNDTVRRIFEDQYALMVRKQADYGPGNISAFGELGVLVRLSDKLERLKHLLVMRDEAGQMAIRARDPANESVDDSYRDLLNYALIALMLRHGSGTCRLIPRTRRYRPRGEDRCGAPPTTIAPGPIGPRVTPRRRRGIRGMPRRSKVC